MKSSSALNTAEVFYPPEAAVSLAVLSRVDPTRTMGLRRQFLAEVNRRFNWLATVIHRAIVDKDVFGLLGGGAENITTLQLPAAKFSLSPEDALRVVRERAFDFPRTADKVDAFMDWLEEMEQRSVLEVTHRPGAIRGVEEAWSDVFVRSAYQKGIQQSRAELRKAGYDIPKFSPDPQQDMAIAFNQPFHADRVGALYTRTFRDLQGITRAMDAQISRTLAQGLVEGRSPLQIARSLTDRVKKIGRTRARTLARTEITRAHHSANVAEARAAGVLGVRIVAEWLTAGFDVCPICEGLASRNNGIYSIDEIEGLIPVHPNCRCSFLPLPYEQWAREGPEVISGTYGYLPDCGEVIPGKFLLSKSNVIVLAAAKCLTATQRQRIKRAKDSHKPATVDIQRQAEANEARLAKVVKGKTSGDNKPFDVVVGTEKNPRHLIEVKTIVRGKNNKITMHPDSLRRKKAFAARFPKAKVHTVVFDDRVGKIYYREGVGSFRLKGMVEVPELKTFSKVLEEGAEAVVEKGKVVKKVPRKKAPLPPVKKKPPKVSVPKSIEEATEMFRDRKYIDPKRGTILAPTENTLKASAELVDELDRITESFDLGKVKDRPLFKLQLKDEDRWLTVDGYSRGGYYPDERMIVLGTKQPAKPTLHMSGGNWSVGTDLRTLFRHEYGHHVYHRGLYFRDWAEVWSQEKDDIARMVSKYAAANEKEAFAECFAAYTSPLYKKKKLPKKVEEFFKTKVAPSLKK